MTVICANNMIYGMTGGQVASTTPLGTLTATTGDGNPYPPFDLCRLVAGAGAAYTARYSVTQPLALMAAVKRALGTDAFTFIEALSPCPTQFGRRNRADSAVQMMRNLMQTCITREEAAGMDKALLKTRIVTGEFNHE
jgi:2-oxoglutarate ferredoxin oxidoreductase subunit beta